MNRRKEYNQTHQILLLNDVAEVVLSYKTNVSSNDREKIACSQDIFEILKSKWSDDQIEYREEFRLVLLNRANRILGIVKISEGGIAGTVCDPIIIMQATILSNASAIILAHNHPSGNTKPSIADNELTAKIRSFCGLLNIIMQDHLIITKENYYSFADEGMI